MSNDQEFAPLSNPLPEPQPASPEKPHDSSAPDSLETHGRNSPQSSLERPVESGDLGTTAYSEFRGEPDGESDDLPSPPELAGEYLPPSQPTGAYLPPLAPQLPLRQRIIPNIGHTLLLLVVAAASLFITEIALFAIAMALHLFGHESPQQLLREPRLLIPCMAVSYLVAGAIAWALFANLWRQPFPQALRWNAPIVRRRSYIFLGIGIVLSVSVQFLSNYLPIPKTLPIDDFFRTPADLWLVAIFGTFLAPIFEELAFRGFLFPSLASAWDWVAQPTARHGPTRGMRYVISRWAAAMQVKAAPRAGEIIAADPQWSTGAIVFSCTLTSIGFAMLHADQLAHSWAPLAVLFTVSVILCLVRLYAHSLAASTLVHASYNGAIFVLIFYATDGFRHLEKLTH